MIDLIQNNRYYVVELKFKKNRCSLITRDKIFGTQRDTLKIDKSQIELVLNHGGIIIIIAEPTPTSLNLPFIRKNSRDECKRELRQKIKLGLAENQIDYEVWFLNQKYLNSINEEYLIHEKPKKKMVYGREIEFQSLPWSKLQRIVPECLVKIKFNAFLTGEIINYVLKFLND